MNAPESPSSAEPVVLSRAGAGIVRLTLNRPQQFNALSEQLLAQLHAELDRIAEDRTARVVVIAGAGKAFCAGHDLKQMRANPSLEYYQRLFADCAWVMRRIQTLPQPVIARVHGIATAAGCQLVAMCDLAVAASEARFAVSGINAGLFCSSPAVALSRNVGRKAAFEMLVTGDFIDAETARGRGLVNQVVPLAELDAAIARLADQILAKPAKAVAMGKDLFYRQLEMGIDAAYQLAGQTMACNMIDEVAQEGVDAFINKRAPKWPSAT
ncbi:MAG TPA: enoyl-CoA hydratase [Burkholderiaceae bacterium]|jgi:enoyl-CoA hydratase/carnithine racemase|nr:enoyl-CoA hydratase [Burkholderiaceae bacterium]